MKRICKYCGKTYEGAPESSACPDCVASRKRTTIAARTCTICGATFQGGPSAKFCPSCLAERKKEQAARRRRTGTLRPIGSTDKCLMCGAEYIVTAGARKYCPACSAEAIRKNDNVQSRRWNAKNTTPEERLSVRKAATAPIQCAVCGKMFVPKGVSITCSPECKKKKQQENRRKWERGNSERRNEYRRNMAKAKVEAMSPEEYEAYREKINARARENYLKRKEKQ